MIANQQQGQLTIGRILRQGLQLHHEAFPQVTRTHARWVEMLQKFAGDVEVVNIYFELGRQQINEFFQVLDKIAIVIQTVDQ